MLFALTFFLDNFMVPASLKAWIDLVSVVKKTYAYGPNGPEGLLKGKHAFVIVSTGGMDVGSAYDFGTRYLRHMLGLFGIRQEDISLLPVARGDKTEADKIIAGLKGLPK